MTLENHIDKLLNQVPEYLQKVACDTNRNTLPFKCTVKTCKNEFFGFENREKYPYKFHIFPLDKKLRKIWKVQCGLKKYDHVKNLMVCSDHFYVDDYVRNYKAEFLNPTFKRKLKDYVYPQKNLGIMENEINLDDIGDSEYDTDVECPQIKEQKAISRTFMSTFPKKYQELIKEIKPKEGPLDYNEVKEEADYTIELHSKESELQKELQTLKSQVRTLDHKVRAAKQKVSFKKKKSGSEIRILKRVFSAAQINLLLGKKATWTNSDLARAFTLRHMGSKKCYLYMKNTLKIPLPSLSCVQRWASSYKL